MSQRMNYTWSIEMLLELAMELREKFKQSRVYIFGTNSIAHIQITTIDEKGNFNGSFAFKISSPILSETLGILSPSVFGVISESVTCGEKCVAILQKGNDAWGIVGVHLELTYGDTSHEIDLTDHRIEGEKILLFLLPFATYGLKYGDIQEQINSFCDGNESLMAQFALLDKTEKVLGGVYEK